MAHKGSLPIYKGPEYKPQDCGGVYHVYKSKKSSSQRTQGGAVAFDLQAKSMCGSGNKDRNHPQNKKPRELQDHLMNCVPPREFSHLCLSQESLANVCLVFDRGSDVAPQLEPPPPPDEQSKPPATKTSKKQTKILSWKSLCISKGDLWIADTINPAKGITYLPLSGDRPFTRIPRIVALEMTGLLSMKESNTFCLALNYGYKCQRGSLCRGDGERIFSDYKYCNMGVQACRAGRGVRESSYHRDGMPVEQWFNIVEMMNRTKKALSSFVETKSLQQLKAAKKMLQFKTISSSWNLQPNKIFGGIAFGINVHLSCRKDHHYTWSVVSVHLHDYQYKSVDTIVAYFCFPRIGVAVPLQPGDLLVFNPKEPHAISSRYNSEDTVYCISMYLKTAIVGLNDNSIPLTSTEDIAKDEYNNMMKS